MDESVANIAFHFHKVSFSLKNRKKLKTFLISIFKQENKKMESLSIVFCSDEYLIDINRRYLDHDYYTDIITFELSDPGKPVQAEIYISAERVRENAKLNKSTFSQELHRVIFHGVLHLTGQKDKLPGQIKQMRKKEDHYLSDYFRMFHVEQKSR